MSGNQYGQTQLPSQQSTLSFTEGFLLGQLSIVILLGAFIKFFIFGDPPPTDAPPRPLSPHKRSASLRVTSHNPSPSTILAKTYYNVASHLPESLDWFNVLVAQTIAQLRADALADNAILTSLTAVLNGPHKPDFVTEIRVTDVELGDDFPIFSNCRVTPVNDRGEEDRAGTGGRLQARMDVDLSDCLTLGVETTMVLNYPRPRTAVLPVALSVSVVRFSGTLAISFLPASAASSPANGGYSSSVLEAQQAKSATQTTLSFSFLPTYTLTLSTRSLLGSRSRLQDVPKIAQLVERRLRTWFEERCVAPRMQAVGVPSLWPRMRNVVDGERREGGEAGRDVREEARREVEAEMEREREREREGLRWRGPQAQGIGWEGTGGMPGAMPGTMIT